MRITAMTDTDRQGNPFVREYHAFLADGYADRLTPTMHDYLVSALGTNFNS